MYKILMKQFKQLSHFSLHLLKELTICVIKVCERLNTLLLLYTITVYEICLQNITQNEYSLQTPEYHSQNITAMAMAIAMAMAETHTAIQYMQSYAPKH